MSESARPATAPRKLTPRQIERRLRILDAAQSLIGRHAYDDVSMRVIAAESQVAEKTLYNIFGSKDRLLAMTAERRSRTVFDAASAVAVEGGWDFLQALTRQIAIVTLDAPAMARTLVQVLLDHSDLVGLDRVYASYLGSALEQMRREGVIVQDAPLVHLTHGLRLGIVATVNFWSKGEIADEALHPALDLQLCQVLLGFAGERHGGPIDVLLVRRTADLIAASATLTT